MGCHPKPIDSYFSRWLKHVKTTNQSSILHHNAQEWENTVDFCLATPGKSGHHWLNPWVLSWCWVKWFDTLLGTSSQFVPYVTNNKHIGSDSCMKSNQKRGKVEVFAAKKTKAGLKHCFESSFEDSDPEGLFHMFPIFCWGGSTTRLFYQWEFQDPKMEVLYHIRPYIVGIFPYIGLT